MILGHFEYEPGQPALGGGAMGNVYRAKDTLTGEEVALKILHPHLAEDDEAIHRLQREARLASRIQHPNVARTLEQGQSGDTYWIAMELVPGRSLRRWIRDERRIDAQSAGRATEAEACAVGLAVSAALAASHAGGLVHRDVKPGNILLPRGFEFQPDAIKLGDFGAARAGDSTFVTRNYSFVGTPEYAAPEAFDGKPVPESDLYSLGATLYEIVAGRPAFSGEFDALRQQHRNKQPDFRPIRKAAPSLAVVIERLLSKNPRDRYGSAEAVHAAIAGIENPIDELALSLDFPAQHDGFVAATVSTISTVWHLPAQWRLASASFAVAALVAGTSVWMLLNDNRGPTTVTATARATAEAEGTVLGVAITPESTSVGQVPPDDGTARADSEGNGGEPSGGGGGSSDESGGGQGDDGNTGGPPPPVSTSTAGSGNGGGGIANTPVPTNTAGSSGGGGTTPPTVGVPTNTPPPTATFTPLPTGTTIATDGSWDTYADGNTAASINGVISLGTHLGKANVVCQRTGCPGADVEFGYTGTASWPSIGGARPIWRPGVDGSSAANGGSYYFTTTLDFPGSIGTGGLYKATLAFAADNGFHIWVDDNYIDWLPDVNPTLAHRDQNITQHFDAGRTSHEITIWVPNGACGGGSTTCTYKDNPAHGMISIEVEAK